MAKYTVELFDLMRHPTFELFDFEYDFYTEDIDVIEKFETKFLNKFAFCEISIKEVFKWKWMLKAKLDEIAPYYKQLYDSEIASANLDWYNNKNYKETFIREIDKALIENGSTSERRNLNSTGSTNNNNKTIQDREVTNTSSILNKKSDAENGSGDADLRDGYLTSISKDEENTNSKEKFNSSDDTKETRTNNTDESGNSQANKNTDEKLTEKTILSGIGNIGVTSSAELVQKRREIILNIDKMILDKELRELFSYVY